MSFENPNPSPSPTPHKVGYARVSTRDQNLDLQTDALRAAGCDRIFEEVMSGAKRARPELERALDHLRAGDTLVIWKLDRLGRSVKDLVELVGDLEKRGVNFQSTTDAIDTSTPAGRFFFHVMASLAQMERELLVERTRAGLEAARAQGRVGGRKRAMTDAKVSAARKLLAAGEAPRDVAESLGVSLPTLYRWIPASERGIGVEVSQHRLRLSSQYLFNNWALRVVTKIATTNRCLSGYVVPLQVDLARSPLFAPVHLLCRVRLSISQ